MNASHSLLFFQIKPNLKFRLAEVIVKVPNFPSIDGWNGPMQSPTQYSKSSYSNFSFLFLIGSLSILPLQQALQSQSSTALDRVQSKIFLILSGPEWFVLKWASSSSMLIFTRFTVSSLVSGACSRFSSFGVSSSEFSMVTFFVSSSSSDDTSESSLDSSSLFTKAANWLVRRTLETNASWTSAFQFDTSTSALQFTVPW